MNYVDEQSGERCRKRHKFSRPHLSRKTSAEDNLTDMVKAALTWSDPKMSYLAYKMKSPSKRSKFDKDGEDQMNEYIDSDAEKRTSMPFSYDEQSDCTDGDCTSDDDDSD